MKLRLLSILFGITFGIVITSCSDNMNYHEYSLYQKDYIDATYDNVTGLVTNIYTMLDYDFGQNYSGGMLASACDEAEYAYPSNTICNFYNGSWSAANPLSGTWTNSYSAIQMCNLFLDSFQGLTFDELKLNSDYEAQMYRYHNYTNEVRFLRAYFYFNLVRQYGDVPLIKHLVTTATVNSLKRTSADSIFAFIGSECDSIVKKIPADYTNLGIYALPSSSAETGRANRLAVLALKARAALYQASPLFNTNSDNELWHKAGLATKVVLDSCAKYGYTLGTYASLWGQTNWSNKEMILVRRMYPDATNTLEGYNFPIGVEGGKSGNCPTQTLVDAYQMKATGKLWNETGSGYNPANPYNGRDPRFALSIAKNGDTGWPAYNTLPIQTYSGGANGEPISGATTTGYYLKKYCDVSVNLTATSINTKRHSWITFRLGEFYLNYAEAVFKYLGSASTTSAEFPLSATAAVNTIRNRSDVKMPLYAAGLSNTDFWTKYEDERMVELAFEDHRFWDLRRWKEGSKLSSIDEMKIIKNADGTYTYNRVTVPRIWDDKMYLFPIPQSEIMKNPNLTQNTGW